MAHFELLIYLCKMLRKGTILLILMCISVFTSTTLHAAKKHHKAKSSHSVAKSSKKSKNALAKHHSKKKGKKGKFVPTPEEIAARKAPQALIAQNQLKKKEEDSVKKTVFANVQKEEEGYFANMFNKQKQLASIQTLEGTAAVFKSVSGWQDKKFYILTNELPVGTVVRITTNDLKSICAKVISALPEVGNNIKYRLNDAAAAILGISNKTFPISVTY